MSGGEVNGKAVLIGLRGGPLHCTARIGYYVETRGRESMAREEELKKAIGKAAVNNRLSCERAHELAQELGVPLREIGAACNELNIKIAACRLGCF